MCYVHIENGCYEHFICLFIVVVVVIVYVWCVCLQMLQLVLLSAMLTNLALSTSSIAHPSVRNSSPSTHNRSLFVPTHELFMAMLGCTYRDGDSRLIMGGGGG